MSHLQTEFKKLAVNEGKCAFIDIHEKSIDHQQIKNFLKYLLVYRITEINMGEA